VGGAINVRVAGDSQVTAVTMVTNMTTVTAETVVTKVPKVAWGFYTKLFPRAEMDVGSHAKCPLLLSNSKKNWNVSTNFRQTPQYKIS
jgi:hypothetical protein